MSERANDLVHIWNICHGCGAEPIVGLRFGCQTCPAGLENDLCESCYRMFQQGRVQHPSPKAREAPAGRHVFRSFEGVPRTQVQPWLAVPLAAAPGPAVPDRCVVRPEFRSGRESFIGSYGFIVAAEDGGQPLLLTALHVLDELAKHKGIDCSADNPAYTGRELLPHVTGVQLYDPFAPNWMMAELGKAGAMLHLPDTRICPEEPYSQRDVAAFRVTAPAPLQPARLAAAPPAVGEPIWLATNLAPGTPGRTAPAVVVEITEQTLVYRFAPHKLATPYTSGSPLLNRAGDVVGINSGGGRLDQHKVGHGSHVGTIRRYLGWLAPS